MDIISKMSERELRFKNLQNDRQIKENEIHMIDDELKKLMGEYNMLVEIGLESGVLIKQDGKILPLEQLKEVKNDKEDTCEL